MSGTFHPAMVKERAASPGTGVTRSMVPPASSTSANSVSATTRSPSVPS
jgi:hypothetical protein